MNALCVGLRLVVLFDVSLDEVQRGRFPAASLSVEPDDVAVRRSKPGNDSSYQFRERLKAKAVVSGVFLGKIVSKLGQRGGGHHYAVASMVSMGMPTMAAC